jgi:general stress protein YciG
MTVQEAGRRGGNRVKEKYGEDYYSQIGQKGGKARAQELGPEGFSELGKAGGRARSMVRLGEPLAPPQGD